ncbi:Protein kinase-like domain and Uncharacterised oxidoreductase Dhs-27 family and CHK kinase-like domain-containing protein [Strongyloides ratti]|uniref:Protein kinase-like domain and Uncharacterized oxidoreductase Dhs-27 family and CHK kinase-like domain-containing protein n=1 Tax=Strongyloides ratti TaxID=34506 RepID=A0A090LIB1_STRRB|nr:Protein kinase-like domain and Uncharacterised oxidoreductase Dhs-27 family and CHK kinase-like domain-containing protein [Strongyloides ratti]CEF69556.1 Protein kinase-like domain and Uncharacterised oxidoreductase Dhs-27 family and CHK kinase-like domain-containing protein [Strongyloides ratti]
MTTSEFFVNQDYGSEYFIGGKITHQWIVDCLDKNDDEFKKYKGNSKIKEINGVDISDGKGFLSKVFKTDIHFDDEKKKPYSIVIKIPGDDSIKESMEKQNIENDMTDDFNIDSIAGFHNKECLFYSKFASKIKFLKYPKCFGCKDLESGKQTGVLIMQFMGSNSKTVPFYRLLNIHQTKSILNDVFKLQEFSLLDSDDSWKGIFQQPFIKNQFKNLQKYIRIKLSDIKCYTSKEMWLNVEKDLDILIENYVKIAEHTYFHLATSKNNFPVIAHGDMWINNFMFEVDSNDNCSNNLSAIIDWQTVHEGNTGCDIARILAISTPFDVRREIEKYYLPDFYKKLKDSIINNGKEMKISYETFINNYKSCFIEQSILSIFMVGFALQEFNVPDDNDYVWDARKFKIGLNIYYNIYDSINFCKEIHPEWLESNK